ncbi:MAG: TrkA C-terminal domain-containing protein [Desulfobacterales bacterium]|nr:TrkA C-terminal domain-containing protein [Desulfobacterales bacterium]
MNLDANDEEALVGPESGLIGKTLVESHIRRDYGVIVVAIKRPDNEKVFNPMSSENLGLGDVIVVFGKKEDLERMKGVMG